MVGVIATVVTTIFGAVVGLIAGFYGGWLDSLISRIVDIFFGLPLIVVGIAALSAISLPGIWGVTFILCLLGWVGAARMVRAQTIEARNQDYTTAARALGASNSRIMVRHILPNADRPEHRAGRRSPSAGSSPPRPRSRSWAWASARRSSPGAR